MYNYSAYNLNLYVKATAPKEHISRFPRVTFIHRFDCNLSMYRSSNYSIIKDTLSASNQFNIITISIVTDIFCKNGIHSLCIANLIMYIYDTRVK